MNEKIFNGKKILVMVVDDQDTFRDAVSFEFEMLGASTLTAANGRDGLEAYKKYKDIDLIISDIRMPEWDGGRFLDELRKISRDRPPFVFMTGFADMMPDEALDSGADAFLVKPLDIEELERLCSKLLTPIEFRWVEEPKVIPEKTIYARFDEISRTDLFQMGRIGFFIAMQDQFSGLKPNKEVGFDIEFQDGFLRKLRGCGKVIWAREKAEGNCLAGYGIDFSFLEPQCREIVIELIRNKSHLKAIPKGEGTVTD